MKVRRWNVRRHVEGLPSEVTVVRLLCKRQVRRGSRPPNLNNYVHMNIKFHCDIRPCDQILCYSWTSLKAMK